MANPTAANYTPTAASTVGHLDGVDLALAALSGGADAASLRTLSGTAAGSNDFAAVFTGTTIPNNSTIAAALQALETALEAVPSRVQQTVADITARDALTGSTNGDLVWVIDASADGTVTSGGAMYIWDGAAWIKVSEGESLDVVTNLGTANVGATTLDITSSTGSDVTVPAATGAAAGVMTAADKAKTDFLAVTQAVDLDAMEIDIAEHQTLLGVADGSTSFGTTFTGNTIGDNSDLVAALQALETAVEGAATEIPGTVGQVLISNGTSDIRQNPISHVSIALPSGVDGVVLDTELPWDATLVQARDSVGGGSFDYDVAINGANVTGASGISVTATTKTTRTATAANTGTAGQSLTVTTSNNASAVNGAIILKLQQTGVYV